MAHPGGLSVAGLRKHIKDKHPKLAKHDTLDASGRYVRLPVW